MQRVRLVGLGALVIAAGLGCGGCSNGASHVGARGAQGAGAAAPVLDGQAQVPPDDAHAGGGPGSDGAAVTPSKPGLTIAPKTSQVSFGGSVQFRATVVGAPDKTVTWSIQEGSGGGTISSTGQYLAPAVSGTFHVVATMNADNSKTDSASVAVTAPEGTPPVLTVGVWTDITPPKVVPLTTYGIDWVAMDPSNPRTLYACGDLIGMWKTTDGGSNWKLLGDPSKASVDKTSGYLDSPIEVRVDPNNSQHLYATQGVRGNSLGFWVSTDGGNTWVQPDAFTTLSKTTTRDVTSMDVDPTDFNHVLVGSHSPWAGLDYAGIMETKDGGTTWIAHPGDPSWTASSVGIHFLFNPALGLGDSQTWIVCHQSAGFYRTTDSGAHWKQVSAFGITHHGNNIYYTKSGDLYAGAALYPVRSKDNGVTWEQLQGGLTYFYYYSVFGDGTNLYTQVAFTGTNTGAPAPYMTSPESDGTTWKPYNGGMQKFTDGPFVMTYDAANHIMYSANWDAGVWALKTQ